MPEGIETLIQRAASEENIGRYTRTSLLTLYEVYLTAFSDCMHVQNEK